MSLSKAVLKMSFLFPRWDMLIPWRVYHLFLQWDDFPNVYCGSPSADIQSHLLGFGVLKVYVDCPKTPKPTSFGGTGCLGRDSPFFEDDNCLFAKGSIVNKVSNQLLLMDVVTSFCHCFFMAEWMVVWCPSPLLNSQDLQYQAPG